MKAKNILRVASFLAAVAILSAFIMVYGYLKYELEAVMYADLAVLMLVTAFLFNIWAFTKQLSRNKTRTPSYYLGVEYSSRVGAGWESFFTLDGNIKGLSTTFWLFLPIAFSGFSNELVRTMFIVEGIVIALILAYGSYTFETSKKIYEDRNPYWYSAWLTQPGWVLAILILVGTVIVTPSPSPLLALILSCIIIVFFLRQFLPQRWFGPNAVRAAYKKKGQSGYIWGRGWKPPK